MKSEHIFRHAAPVFGALMFCNAMGAVLYVDQNSTNPVPPFVDWTTATTNIQDAVDAANPGDLILVTNGVYQNGGRVVYGALTNRVALNKPVTLQSVNGPGATSIEGYQVPGQVNGDSAVRCVYMTNGAALLGFTLTNGATRIAGDQRTENSGGGIWCETNGASYISNCVVISNTCAFLAAGVYGGFISNSFLTGNINHNGSLGGGGGAAYSTLINSTVSGNITSQGDGGGALFCMLSNCVVTANTDIGAGRCTLYNCVVTANNGTGISGTAAGNGSSFAVNCLVSSNASASLYGGGCYNAVLVNCTIYSNIATHGGGAYDCTLISCTLSNNFASQQGGGLYMDGPGGSNEIYNCSFYNNTALLDGGGLYFFESPLTRVISNCVVSGNAAVNGGGIAFEAAAPIVTNCTFFSNSASGSGGAVYSSSGGAPALVNCWLSGNSAASNGGACYGCSLFHCLVLSNWASIGGGVYGPANSIPTMTNCIVQGNYATNNGGGADNLTCNRCIFTWNQAGLGGALCDSQPKNSLIIANSATFGGAAAGTMSSVDLIVNCTVVSNSASSAGGGLYGPNTAPINSIIYYNIAPTGANYTLPASGQNSCTWPMLPSGGTHIITNTPGFIDLPGGNFRLQTNSPCINQGDNAYASAAATDLDGRPRIVGGTVDIGAYEFQGPGVGEFTAWLQRYGLATDGSADYADSDGDGMNNWQEWVADTNPTNPLSRLVMYPPSVSGSGASVSWQSTNSRTYFLLRSTNLQSLPPFSVIQSNIQGQVGATTFTDSTTTNSGPYFYRVGVQ